MAATPSGDGYWLAVDDGTVLALGAAGYFGGAGGSTAEPIAAMFSAAGGGGYYLVDESGRVFTFGGAVHYGDASAFGSAVVDAVPAPKNALLGRDG